MVKEQDTAYLHKSTQSHRVISNPKKVLTILFDGAWSLAKGPQENHSLH